MGNGQSSPSENSPDSNLSPSEKSTASACPVDPTAREAWLAAAAKGRSSSTPLPPFHPSISNKKPTGSSASDGKAPKAPIISKSRPLSTQREVSSIPRSTSSPYTSTPSPTSRPSSFSSSDSPSSQATAFSSPNAQTSNPSTSSTGNWIYPSESMFFAALQRKAAAAASASTPISPSPSAPTAFSQSASPSSSSSPREDDMPFIVPIHNAVNERAWSQIKSWETQYASQENSSCGGPRLLSFRGDSGKLTPRARWLGLWGYERPFDRHDWVVERCPPPSTPSAGSGTVGGRGSTGATARTVEYVIDFYRGRESERGGGRPGAVNFYLDVRPKLNSFEGWRMRVRRFWGI